MSYTKTTWRNNQAPAINADNLNHMEQGIESAHNQIDVNTSNIESLTTQVQNNATNIASEISARQTTDSSLQSQIDQLVAPTGEAPTPAEIENARIGDDGVTYDTLGNAIRGQFSDVKSAIDDLNDAVFESDDKNIEWVAGLVNVGNFTSSNKDKCSKPFVLKSGETVKVKTKGDGSYLFRVLAKFSSLDAPISAGESGGTLITVISGNSLTEYTYTATEAEEYIGVCVFDDETSTVAFENVVKEDKVAKNASDIEALDERVADIETEIEYTYPKDLEWVTGFCMVGNFTAKSGDKVSKPFTLYKGETVSIKTKGDGSYLFTTISKVPSLDIPIAAGYSSGTRITWITTNSLTTYSYTADEDEYIVLGGLDDPTTTVEFSNLKTVTRFDVLQDEIDDIKDYSNGILRNKSVMFFGDSLTAASTTGVYGFAERIADEYGMPYKHLGTDSADGNPEDTPVDYNRFTNYAKDGTTNRNVSGRSDSVLQRVKRHITEDTIVDYVLIECCVNDMAIELRNKGAISESYTATYDTDTSIGALEETLRYLTTLSNNIRIGGFIPWLISWEADGWFDDYIAVFEKWGVPLFDMRNTSGFNLRYCGAHRQRYTLSADNYSAYDNTATYNLDDKVKYGGILYKCLSNGVTGKVPTDTTYWMEVSSESSDGTHLNSTGHYVVAGKIQKFIESC